MSRLTRELRPALTAQEMAEADDVYRHAASHDIRLRGNQPVRAVVRCNQLGPTFAACDWTRRIETTAYNAERISKQYLAAHLTESHPYLGSVGVAKITSGAWVNLRDIGG
jgi:hypothetical protein